MGVGCGIIRHKMFEEDQTCQAKESGFALKITPEAERTNKKTSMTDAHECVRVFMRMCVLFSARDSLCVYVVCWPLTLGSLPVSDRKC